MSSGVSLMQERVAELIEPILEELGLELVDVEFLSSQGRWVLRLYIDKNGGVTVDDCALVSREVGDLIDVKDIINQEYVLEVSSPGLNRSLKKEKDFVRAIGSRIKVKTIFPVNGRRNYKGTLTDFKQETMYLEMEDGTTSFHLMEVDKANIIYQFNP